MFREFKVGELFDVTQGRRLKKSDFEDGDIPFVMASSKNNGVVAYVSNPVTTNENFITVDSLGNAFYHNGFVGFGDENCSLKLKNGMDSETIYLYLVGVLSCFKPIASYSNKLYGKWYREQFIQLPVKPGTDSSDYTQDDIDWAYMESYIHDLEQSFIRELDAYLKETGLDDYRLTTDEHVLLDRELIFRDFKVGELFDVKQGRRLKKSDFIDGNIPFVMASSQNNGVVAHISNPVTTNENFITADILGNVFYHGGFVGFGDDNCSLKLKNAKESEAIYLYLVSILLGFKSIASYGNKLRGKWYKEQFIKLPVKPGTDEVNYTQDDIDWDYMESYIRIMEKRVIVDVVDYKNEAIVLTKECASEN